MDSIRTKNEPSHLQEKPWKIHPHLCGLKNDFPLFQFRGTPSDMILYALECNLAKFPNLKNSLIFEALYTVLSVLSLWTCNIIKWLSLLAEVVDFK